MEKEKVLFVYNPRAGKGTLRNKLADIIDMMMKRQWDVSIAATQKAGDAVEYIIQKGIGCDRVICSGGDGTLHEVMILLHNSYEEAKRLISSHRKALDKIAAYLIRKETITGKEFMIIFRAVEKGMEVSDVLDAEGLKALDEAVKAEDKTDEANADTETAESAIAVPAIEQYR